MPNKSDYDVGYGKPPEATRFKKGRSGNPQGRPKKERDTFGTLLDQELRSQVVIVENGKRKKSSKAGAITKQLVNKAVGGDHRSTSLLMKLAEALNPQKGTKITTFRPQTEEERLEHENSREHVLAKLRRMHEAYQAEQERKKAAAEPDQAKSDSIKGAD